MDIASRFLKPKAGNFFLFGPRGTGKSLWLKQHFPAALVVDLLAPDAQRQLAARPEGLIDRIRAEPATRIFVIDEVQKVPELLDAVHLLMEENQQRRFILTGSSARKLRRGGVNLLAGRAGTLRMHPFLAAEIPQEFRLEQALRWGLIPVVVAAQDPPSALNAYIDLYVREEVMMEGLTRALGGFSRFLETVSFSHGNLINVSSIAREAQAGRRAIESYLGILEDLLLAFRLPVFARRARRAVTAHDKFFFADTGLFRLLRPSGPLDHHGDIEGQALEGLIAQHLRAWIDYRNQADRLYYWRTRAGSEVDFVIYGEGGLWGIEVKRATRVRSEDLRGLKSFLDEYPEGQGLLLHRGPHRELRGKILLLPCDEFLRALHPDLSLEDIVR